MWNELIRGAGSPNHGGYYHGGCIHEPMVESAKLGIFKAKLHVYM